MKATSGFINFIPLIIGAIVTVAVTGTGYFALNTYKDYQAEQVAEKVRLEEF